jgi:hypothetical protein
MKKPKLVDDWRSFLRWYSTWANAVLAAVGGVWLMIPEDMRAAVQPEILGGVAIFLALSGTIGRLIKQ